MKKALLALVVVVFAVFTLSIGGCGDDADCNAGAKDKCTSDFTTCTTQCALSGNQACAEQCAVDKCKCLEDAGCPCD